MSNTIKYYDCWGVPYVTWQNEETGEYLCGVYDIDLGYYACAGSMATVLWDGLEITPEDAAILVNKYTESVMYREQRRSNSYHVTPGAYRKMQSDIKNNNKRFDDLFTREEDKNNK